MLFRAIDDEPVAMFVAFSDLNPMISDLDGRLLPFGWIKLGWRIFTRTTFYRARACPSWAGCRSTTVGDVHGASPRHAGGGNELGAQSSDGALDRVDRRESNNFRVGKAPAFARSDTGTTKGGMVPRQRYYGGYQWYFVCPYENRYVSVLWRPPGARNFACRQHWGRQVAYATQFLDRDNRAHYGQSNIKNRLIADLDPDEWSLPLS